MKQPVLCALRWCVRKQFLSQRDPSLNGDFTPPICVPLTPNAVFTKLRLAVLRTPDPWCFFQHVSVYPSNYTSEGNYSPLLGMLTQVAK